jgi:hypothetical protein
MGERIIRIVAAGWGLLLGTAAGGFLGANVAGLIAGSISFATAGQHAPDMQPVQWWMHCGWLVGAGVFLTAGIVHHVKKARRPPPEESDGTTSSRRDRRKSDSESNRFRVTVDGRPCGVLGSIGVGSLAGALLGLFLGGSLLLLWFSITYSPFAPAEWVESVSLEKQPIDGALRERRVATTRHPIALYAFVGPIVVGAAAGGLLAGTDTAIQKFRDRGSVADKTG